MSVLTFGVIGCGMIGTRHLQSAAALDGVAVTAVADIDHARATATAQRFDVPTVHDDASKLIADPDVDAIVVALPAGVRHPVALAVLEAGKHLLTEKPTAMDARQVEELIAARRDGVVAASCSSRVHYAEPAAVARRALRTGVLGTLRHIHVRGLVPSPARPEVLPPPWRLSRAQNAGGVLSNWGCYDLDYVLGLLDWSIRPQSVFAMTWPIAPGLAGWVVPESDAETHAVAMVRCADDIVLTIERAEYLPHDKVGTWEIIGTDATLSPAMVPAPGAQVVLTRAGDAGVRTETLWRGEFDTNTWHEGLLADFVAAIRDRRPPATPLEHALTVSRITDAIYHSASTGTLATID